MSRLVVIELALAPGMILPAISVAAQTLGPVCHEGSPPGIVRRELTNGYDAILTRSDSGPIELACSLVVTMREDTLLRFESLRAALCG